MKFSEEINKQLDRYSKYFDEEFPRREMFYMTEKQLKKHVDDCINEQLTYYELQDVLYGGNLTP